MRGAGCPSIGVAVAQDLASTDLKSLREFVANVLDYDPTSETYARQIDSLLNEAERSITGEKAFAFVQAQRDFPVYRDRTDTVSFDTSRNYVTSTGALFEAWMVNQELLVGSTTYVIGGIIDSWNAYIDRYADETVSATASVVHRYVDLPPEATSIMSISRRTASGSSPGMLDPLPRFEDEWQNLPMDEPGLPWCWVPYEPAFIKGPRQGFTVATAAAAGPGRGVRTVEFCCTFIRNGRESPHGGIVSISATDSQEIVLTPMAINAVSGNQKRYYWRCPTEGYHAFRLLDEPGTTNPMEIAPGDVAPRTLSQLTVTSLAGGEGLFDDTRLEHPDGWIQRVRLHPRQDADYTFTVRYMRNYPAMREDSDTSVIPPKFRVLIAYRALADALSKHGNETQAMLWEKKFRPKLLQLEDRFLPTARSQRVVKGGSWFGVGRERNKYTSLVHT
jgi:hypothetical protein